MNPFGQMTRGPRLPHMKQPHTITVCLPDLNDGARQDELKRSPSERQTRTCCEFLPISKDDSSVHRTFFQSSIVIFWCLWANARRFAWLTSLINGDSALDALLVECIGNC